MSAATLRIYASVRTAHLERFQHMVHSDVLYHRTRYDFDPELAKALPEFRQVSRRDVLRRLATRSYAAVEINEPIMVDRWKDLLAQIALIRLRDLLTWHRTRIVAYCIGLTDPVDDLADRGRPRWLTRVVSRLAMTLIVAGTDGLAFGTSGSHDLYARYVPTRLLRRRARLFEALPTGCDCVRQIDAPRTSPTTLLFVGAFDDRKGIRPTMAAWEHVHEQRPDLRLHLIGKGRYVEEVVSWAADRSEVQVGIDPPRDRIHAAMRESGALILLSQRIGSWREQVGLPIVEALSHGCPVVTTSETGLAEWLLAHGHTVLAPKDGPAVVAAAAVAALDEARERRSVLADLPDGDRRIEADAWMMSEPGR
jgi:glycosyltransferase involved in cell wall biosynthesis